MLRVIHNKGVDQGIIATAEVIDNKKDYSSRLLYYPIIKFSTKNGDWVNEPTPTQGYGVSMGNNLMIDSRVGVPDQGN